MNPPWKEFPHIEPGCVGWRMGDSEDYLDRFKAWLEGVTLKEFRAWLRANPPPKGWEWVRNWASL